MRRAISITALLILGAFGAAWSGGTQSSLRCTLTGKTIAACCCQQKNGKLYCPLAKKTIASCCCQSTAK